MLRECATTEVKVGDNCLPLLQTVNGLALDFRLKIFYPVEKFVLESEDQFFTDVHTLLNIHFIFVCAEHILSIERAGEMVVVRTQITLYKGDNSQNFNILEELQTLQKAIVQYNKMASKTNSIESIELFDTGFEPITDSSVSFVVYSDYRSFNKCGPAVAISPMQFCKTVMIKNFKIIENDALIVDGHSSFLPGEYILTHLGNNSRQNGRPTAYICYDLFVTKVSQSSDMTGSGIIIIKRDIGEMIYIIITISLMFQPCNDLFVV